MAKFSNKIAIFFNHFGPYHVARLEALGAMAKIKGFEVWGLETFCQESSYPWKIMNKGHNFSWIRLFPNEKYGDKNIVSLMKAGLSCLRKLSPDVVVTAGYSEPIMWAGLIWAKWRRVPVVVMGDSKYDDFPRPTQKEKLKRKLVSRFDSALVAGSPQISYFSSLGIPLTRIFTGYDVVDNEHFRKGAAKARQQQITLQKSLGLPEHYFLAVSRFIPKKNLSRLLRAYHCYQTLAKHDPWGLVICGAGPLESALREQARDIPGIQFHGFQQVDILPVYYGLAGCFVVPSSHDEPWGLVVNEAMASGLPVLVSKKCGCVQDLVQEGVNGFIFNPLDTEELAQLMVKMSSGELDLEAMGQASQQIISRWTPEVFAENLLQAVAVAAKNHK